jgi:hypothetical protein
MGRSLGDRRNAARGAHDERLGKAGLGTARGEAVEVPGERRPEVRVDRRRRRALVLAELRGDLVGGDDPRVGQPAPQLGGELALVTLVAEREEQADGDCVSIDLGQGLEVEWAQHPLGPDALGNCDAALQRHERLGVVLAEPVEVRPRLAPQMEDVLEPLGRDERRARAFALEQRVRGDGRAVREALELSGADRLGGREHGLLLARRGRDLRRRHATLVDEHGVREGAADVDTENAHGANAASY